MAKFKKILGSYFLAGLFIILPAIITYYIVYFLLTFIGKFFYPLVSTALQHYLNYIPFGLRNLISVFLAIFFILVVGFITTGFLGQRFLKQIEGILMHIPIIRGIYFSSQKLTNILLPGKSEFQRVVCIEFPHPGTYGIGFITNEKGWNLACCPKERLLAIFLPTAPNPTTGFFLLVPEKDVHPLPITVDEAIKLIISGGIVSPPQTLIDRRDKNR